MDTKNRITLRIRGLDEDNGDVRLSVFVQELEILRKTLSETQKLMGNDEVAYFKIVELQKNSPAQVVVEPVPTKIEYQEQADNLVDLLFRNIANIQLGVYPTGFSYETLEAYKELTSLRDKKRISEIAIFREGGEVNYLTDFSSNIEKIKGNDEFEYGSYSGMLDAINIHNQNIFYIYRSTHSPKLKCSFSEELKDRAIAAIGKYVTICGIKKFLPNIEDDIPYEMFVKEIDIHPDEDKLPTLRELKGISSSGIPNGMSSETFIRGMRNEW